MSATFYNKLETKSLFDLYLHLGLIIVIDSFEKYY